MHRKLLSVLMMAFVLFTTNATFAAVANIKHPHSLSLVSYDVFNGDRHNEFQGDLVAVLSDGSAWKVHPLDREMFSLWGANDVVQVGLRTSIYFFKREHKFEIRNLTRNQTIRVMLVEYPKEPLYIVATEIYLTRKAVPSPSSSRVKYQDVCEKRVTLNNGSQWIISNEDKFDSFNVGSYVYLIFNVINRVNYYYLISGIEREAAVTGVN